MGYLPFGLVVGLKTRPLLFLHDMAKSKKSFILYCDLIHTLEKMPDDKAGQLFKHILRYVNDLDPVTDDLIVNLTFEPIKQQLKRDLMAWEKTNEAQSLSGRIGNLKRWHRDLYDLYLKGAPIEELEVIAFNRKPSLPDTTQSHPIANIADTVTDNDTDNVSDIKIEEPPKGVPPKIFVPDFESYPIIYRQGLKLWWEYKIEKKQKYKPTGWETFVKSAMEDFPDAVKFNEALKHSISNNYSGLYPKIKQEDKPNNKPANLTDDGSYS